MMIKINKDTVSPVIVRINEDGSNPYTGYFVFEFKQIAGDGTQKVITENISPYPENFMFFNLSGITLNCGEYTFNVYNPIIESDDITGLISIYEGFSKIIENQTPTQIINYTIPETKVLNYDIPD